TVPGRLRTAQARASPAAGCRLPVEHAEQQRQRGDAEEHPRDGDDASAKPVVERAADRRDRAEQHRDDRQPQAGGERRIAIGADEDERHEKEQAEQRGPCHEPGDVAAGEAPWRKSARSTSGAGACRSVRTNSANRITASRRAARKSGDVVPQAWPSLSTVISAVSAGTISSAPVQSKRWSLGSVVVCGITNQPMTAPARPKGTLIQNTHCQPSVSITRPPMAGPAPRPTAWAADWMPSARPRRSSPAVMTMMATLLD